MRDGELWILSRWNVHEGRLEGEGARYGADRLPLGKAGAARIPLDAIAVLETAGRVRVRRHELTSRRGWIWTAVGALTTGGALTLACSSGENSGCGGVSLAVGLSWLLLGGLPSLSLDKSAHATLDKPSAETLRAFARFPQGPPEGIDLQTLLPGTRRPKIPRPQETPE